MSGAVQLHAQLGDGRVGDGVAGAVFGGIGERDPARARLAGIALPAGHLEGHDRLRCAERRGVVRQLVDAHELDPDPVVVVVELGASRPCGWRDGGIEGRQRAREDAFRFARVRAVEIGAQAHQSRVDAALSSPSGSIHASDDGREARAEAPRP